MEKWKVVSLLWGALATVSVIRVALSIVAPTLMEEYDISPSAMGIVMSGWNWTYTGSQLLMGPLVDRFGTWSVQGIGSGVWGLATLALPLATAAVSLFLMRALFGLGHSMLIPAQASAISRWFGPRERSTALGFCFSASQVGVAIGAMIAAFLLARYGWQSVFYWIGGASLLFTLKWFLLYPDKRLGVQSDVEPRQESSVPTRVPLSSLLRHRSAWGLAFGQMGYLYAYHVFVNWLPAYLILERDMSVVRTGIVASLPFLVGMIATIGGGWLGDFVIRRGYSPTFARKAIVGTGMMIATVLVVTAAYTPQTWLAVTLLTLCMGFLRATTGSANAMPIDLAPRTAVGSLTSIQNFGGNVGGLMAPIVTGFILEATGTFTGALVVAGAVMLFGAISYVFIVGPIERMEITAGRPAEIPNSKT